MSVSHMVRFSWRRVIVVIALFFVAGTGLFRATARQDAAGQAAVVDLDPAIECWYHDAFPQLIASMTPSGETARSRLYFRCEAYPDYYFVDLEERGSGGFLGVGPQAEETCSAVVYYVESLSFDFASTRTPERTVPVTTHDQCRRRFPVAALFEGDPELFVGSTSLSATQMAPGFKAIGVKGFISAATGQIAGAAATGGGGGISAGALAGIAAGVGGAGALVAASGGDTTTTMSAGSAPTPAPATTSMPPATTTSTIPASQPVVACVQTNPMNATIQAGERIVLDARCSQGQSDAIRADWNLGDGRTREDTYFVQPVFNDAGTFTVTLTLSDRAAGVRSGPSAVLDTFETRVTVESPPAKACFTISGAGVADSQCFVDTNANCSQGDIVAYDWEVVDNNTLGKTFASGPAVAWNLVGCSYPGPPDNFDFILTVTDSSGRSDTLAQTASVVHLSSPQLRATQLPSSFTSYLGVAPYDGNSKAQVRIGESRLDMITNASPRRHDYQGKFGDNAVEVVIPQSLSEPGFLRFDFSGARHLVEGSIRVKSGQVISLDGRKIVFRLAGTPGERIAFTYQLLP